MADRARRSDLDRRGLLRRAALLGAAGIGLPAGLGACATGGGGEKKQAERKKKTKDNPFGVDPKADLEVVIFNGGFKDKYALFAEGMYKQRHGIQPDHFKTEQIAQTQQSKFNTGKPPDVLDNSGAQKIDVFALIEKKQVHPLTELLAAPSWDIPGKTVKETIVDGMLDSWILEDTAYVLPLTMNLYGIWHDKVLFDQNSWEPPTTWDQFFALGEKIKRAKPGIAPWIYQGSHPGYMKTLLITMIQKRGGNEVMRAVDNLEAGAWEHDSVADALGVFEEMKKRKFITRGIGGIEFTKAQVMWANREAAFIPCGSWLKSEIGSSLPEDVEMEVQPAYSFDKSDKLPFGSSPFTPTEEFIIPSAADNIPGAMDFLRILMSKKHAQKFAELTSTLTVVDGAHDDQELDATAKSSLAILTNARKSPPLEQTMLSKWYKKFGESLDQKLGLLLTENLTTKQFVAFAEQGAQKVKKDPKLKKYTR